MGAIRTLPKVTLVTGEIIPVYTGAVIAAVSTSITKGIAKIVLGAANLPKVGYNGPNGYPINNAVGARFDIHGGITPKNPAGGDQVTLWGFATLTYFNGVVVTVIDNDPTDGSFRFYFNHADVGSTNDTGNTAAAPVDKFRVVRIECGQGNTTDLVYVGDLNLSSTQYAAALSLAGQIAFEISGQNIDASRIFVLGTTGDTVQISVVQ